MDSARLAALRGPHLRGDLLAGVTVAAYLVPQVMAYAELAGLPAATGLWATVGALAVYAVLGSSPQLSVGPESTTALMTAAALGTVAAAGTTRAELAVVLAVLVGLIAFAGWWLRLSFLSDLLSKPVLVGYLAGIAVLMILSQAGKLTGTSPEGDSPLAQAWWVLRHGAALHRPTVVLALVTLVLMLAVAAWAPHAPVALMGVLGAAAAGAWLDLADRGVALVGTIPAGLPAPEVPSVGVADVAGLVGPALAVAFVGYTDNVLTARAFAEKYGDQVDVRREMAAFGAANLGAALTHGMPVSSSGSRTAIGAAVGGRTRRAGIATLVVTVIAVLTLGPVLAAFPLAALGAVVVYAALRLVDVAEFRRILRFRRSEFLIALATGLAVVTVDVLWGILVAIGLSVLDLLRRVARPHDAVLGFAPGIPGMHDVDDYPDAELVPGLLVYRYDAPLCFANADDFARRARATVAAAATPVRWFVLNSEAIVDVDLTAADALRSLREDLVGQGIEFALVRIKQDLRSVLAPTGLLEEIGEDRLFPTLPTAVEAYRAAAPAPDSAEHDDRDAEVDRQ